MFSYFNLNNHIYRPDKVAFKTLKLEKEVKKENTKLPFWKQLMMYLGVCVGIFFSAAVNQFNKGGDVDISFNFGKLVITLIVALTIIPFVYEKLRLDPEAPILVQFGVFVQNGVFWQVLFNSAGKII